MRCRPCSPAWTSSRWPRGTVLELSGGERQRVALAQCALQGAPLLLLDEPVAFQDPAHQALVARWLSSRCRGDQALVISAHDVNWIARTATHVLALLPDGRCEQGVATAMLEASRLERVYGCGWREVGGCGWQTSASESGGALRGSIVTHYFDRAPSIAVAQAARRPQRSVVPCGRSGRRRQTQSVDGPDRADRRKRRHRREVALGVCRRPETAINCGSAARRPPSSPWASAAAGRRRR